MKSLLVMGSLLLALPLAAEMEKSPMEFYSVKQLMTRKVSVRVRVVRNVQQSCEDESHKLQLGGFGYPMEACSFWTNGDGTYACTIIVGEETNNNILGHEFRHCIQGHFHDQPTR